jgi:hypothetical protein
MKKIASFFASAYQKLSPYVLPGVMALAIYFYSSIPEPVVIEGKPWIETVTTTRWLPARIDTVEFEFTNTVHDTLIDTLYVKGETIYVETASADTVFNFAADDENGIHMDMDVWVASTYYHKPVNLMKMSGKLNNVRLILPKKFTRTFYFTAGAFNYGNSVGLSVGSIYKNHFISAGYGDGTTLFQYQHIFNK